MFCPKCRVEYQEGYLECSDCKTELVPDLPPESLFEPVYVECEPLASITDIGMIAVIKSILDEEKITYYFNGEEAVHIYPGVPVQLFVRKSQSTQAREVLKDLLEAAPETETETT